VMLWRRGSLDVSSRGVVGYTAEASCGTRSFNSAIVIKGGHGRFTERRWYCGGGGRSAIASVCMVGRMRVLWIERRRGSYRFILYFT
jgi:hypothetical protein